MRVWGIRVAVWSGLVVLCGAPAWAAYDADAPSHTGAESDRIEDTMTRFGIQPAMDKLGRGASNFLGGWLEIPYTIHQHTIQSDTGGSFFAGAARGTVRGVIRTAVGAYEVVTFLLPYPEDFRPILPTLPYFDTRGRTERLPLE